jgi:hypothetical protein
LIWVSCGQNITRYEQLGTAWTGGLGRFMTDEMQASGSGRFMNASEQSCHSRPAGPASLSRNR